MKKGTTLNELTKEALYLVDNCAIYKEGEFKDFEDATSSQNSGSRSTTKYASKNEPKATHDQIVEDVLKKLNLTYRPQVKQAKWRAIEQKWTNHVTKECVHNKGYVREHQHAPPAQVAPPQVPPIPRYVTGNLPGPMGMERPQHVLGQQPPLPETTPIGVSYAPTVEELGEQALEPVSAYYEESSGYETNLTYYPPEEVKILEPWISNGGPPTTVNPMGEILIKDNLYKRGKDGQLRMCATEEKYILILQQAHSGQTGGHFSTEKMAKSILYAGIWWPTLFMDAKEFVKRCDECQRTKTPRGRDDMPLRPMMGARAFAKRGIDFVGSIAPPAYKSHAQYIIVAIDYLTKWVEAKATTKNDAKTIAQFLYENIFTRYGLPIEIVSDRGTHFINEVIENLLDEFMVVHRKSAPYHPQANGQAESTNKILVTVLTKIVNESRADWDQKLHSALWAYRVAYKTSIGTTPFNMVYGIRAILPLEFLIPALPIAKELEWTGHELSKQIEVLEKLDETRLRAVASIYAQKRNMKSFFDQHVINKEFATGDYVRMYTLKQHSKKIQK
ncbi:hypothetical protein L7F22_021201 [Adiantum nelumboides]|nr:hypothetical protein [Adiantum nelumboides]